MTERIVLSVIAIFMLVLTLRKGDRQNIFLTAGLTIGILITWAGIPVIITIGQITYMLTALLISLANLSTKELSKLSQISIILSGIWAFGVNLFSIMNWPFAEVIRFSLIIPLILYLISLINGMIKRKELGYLTIMNVDFILRLIR